MIKLNRHIVLLALSIISITPAAKPLPQGVVNAIWREIRLANNTLERDQLRRLNTALITPLNDLAQNTPHAIRQTIADIMSEHGAQLPANAAYNKCSRVEAQKAFQCSTELRTLNCACEENRLLCTTCIQHQCIEAIPADLQLSAEVAADLANRYFPDFTCPTCNQPGYVVTQPLDASILATMQRDFFKNITHNGQNQFTSAFGTGFAAKILSASTPTPDVEEEDDEITAITGNNTTDDPSEDRVRTPIPPVTQRLVTPPNTQDDATLAQLLQEQEDAQQQPVPTTQQREETPPNTQDDATLARQLAEQEAEQAAHNLQQQEYSQQQQQEPQSVATTQQRASTPTVERDAQLAAQLAQEEEQLQQQPPAPTTQQREGTPSNTQDDATLARQLAEQEAEQAARNLQQQEYSQQQQQEPQSVPTTQQRASTPTVDRDAQLAAQLAREEEELQQQEAEQAARRLQEAEYADQQTQQQDRPATPETPAQAAARQEAAQQNAQRLHREFLAQERAQQQQRQQSPVPAQQLLRLAQQPGGIPQTTLQELITTAEEANREYRQEQQRPTTPGQRQQGSMPGCNQQ